jgi:predicted HTH transcriptional regulator
LNFFNLSIQTAFTTFRKEEKITEFYIKYKVMTGIETIKNNLIDRILTEKDRLEYFVSLNKIEFTRKGYMDVFKDISSVTASRDLKNGVKTNLFEKIGEKNKTKYRLVTGHNS